MFTFYSLLKYKHDELDILCCGEIRPFTVIKMMERTYI
jgi:hypothetical protein